MQEEIQKLKETHKEQEHQSEIRSLNYKWAIGIIASLLLVSIAISLVFWLCDKEYCRLLSVLDMISTLLAITLSVFSILFSYSTSQDASRALSSVASEVSRIETTNTQIEKHMSTILEHIGRRGTKQEPEVIKEEKSGETEDNNLPKNNV